MSEKKISITVSQGVELAVRHPERASSILAKGFAKQIKMQPWMNKKVITRFFVLFMNNILDQGIEDPVSENLYKRVSALPFHQGLRLLRRFPDEGLKVLVKIVIQELRDKQKLPLLEQLTFYNELFENLFPDIPFVNQTEIIRSRSSGNRVR